MTVQTLDTLNLLLEDFKQTFHRIEHVKTNYKTKARIKHKLLAKVHAMCFYQLHFCRFSFKTMRAMRTRRLARVSVLSVNIKVK